jgi:YVTN family beta-propeller protein
VNPFTVTVGSNNELTVTNNYDGTHSVLAVTGALPPDVISKTHAPTTLRDLYNKVRAVTDDQFRYPNGIDVQTVRGDDGKNRLIVYIGGTTNDVWTGDQAKAENITAVAGVLKPDQIRAIKNALEACSGDAACGQISEIMLVGYSQGGIDAQNLAAPNTIINAALLADPSFASTVRALPSLVTAVITYGSPITTTPSSGDAVLHVQDRFDAVPRLVLPLGPLYFGGLATLARIPFGTAYDGISGKFNVLDPTFGTHSDPDTYRILGDQITNDHPTEFTNVEDAIDRFAGTLIKPGASTTSPTVGPGIPVGNRPVGTAISPDGHYVYVANYDDDTVSVIDTTTSRVLGDPIPVADGPHDLVVSPDGKSLYVITNFTMSVIDTASNTAVGNPILLAGGPSGIAISPNGRYLYISAFGDSGTSVNGVWGSGTLSVVDTATNFIVGDPIPLGWYPSTVEVSPNGRYVYVANFWDFTLSIIDTATNTTVGTRVPVGGLTQDLAFNADGSQLYIVDSEHSNGGVKVLDTATNTVVGSIDIGAYSARAVRSPDGSRLYISDNGSGTVWVIDTATNSVVGERIPVGSYPHSLVVSPNGRYLYVTDYGLDAVFVVDTDPTEG